MAESIVQDWLAEYEAIEDSAEMTTFSNIHEHNQEIAQSLYTIFNERLKYPEMIHAICNQFHSFYRSEEEQLKRFTLQFIPVLIYIYLNSVAVGDKKNCRSVETLLITIYNVEVSTDDCNPKIVSFRMPVLAQASVYHEEKSLHPTDLRRWEENSNRDVKWGPLSQVEAINAQNRMKIMTALLFSYNQQLSIIQKSALYHLCRVAGQTVNQGFSKLGHVQRSSYGQDPNLTIAPKPLPRIPLSSQFLVELVHSIYFAMFNGFGTIAIQTMDDIHHRACFEMYPDLLLVTNSVRNSLNANPSGQPSDGPMGLSVALTPATNTVVVSKSMITNASFRTKKLPDDLDMEFLASLPHQIISERFNESAEFILEEQAAASNAGGAQQSKSIKNPKRWKNWGWKHSPGSKTSSIEEEPPDSPKKSSLSSSKNSSPNASPKIRAKNVVQQKTDNDSTNSALMLLPAVIRRKKSPSPSKKSEIRLSADARLYTTLNDGINETNITDSLDDSCDEYDSLLGNARPASIHVIQTSNDDIPIQEDQHNSSAAPLMSISEESNEKDQSSQIGTRNSSARSSKEGGIKAQAHKALIAGFKKARDKDKEKESKSVTNKNGEIFMNEIKATPKEPPIPPVRRMLNRALNSSSGSGETVISNHPPMLKNKHVESSIETMVQMQNLTNGGNSGYSEGEITSDSLDNSFFDASESIDSNYDGQTNRSSVVLNESHKLEMSQI